MGNTEIWLKSQPEVGWHRIGFIQHIGEMSLLALEMDILFEFSTDVFFDVCLSGLTTSVVHAYLNI